MDPTGDRAGGAAANGGRMLAGPWLVLVAVAGGMMLEAMDATVVSVANASISEEMNANLLQLQWLTNGYLFSQAVLLITAGKLGDRFGHRRMFFLGMIGFVVASVLVGVSGTVNQMIVFRVLQGVCAAVLMPSALGILRAVFPPDRLKVAIGIFMSAFVVGGILGPIIGGVLVDFASWRWVFLVNLPLGAAALVLGALTIGRTPLGRSEPLDLPGILLLTVSLLALFLGLSQGPYLGWTSVFCLTSFVVAAAAGLLFVRREQATDEPMLPPSVFRRGPVSAAVVITILSLGLASAAWFYLVLFLQQVQGYRPLAAGFALLPVPVAIVVGSSASGVLNRRFGARTPILAGLVLISAGLFGLSRISELSTYHQILPLLAASGLGVGLVAPASTEVVVSNAPKAMTGVASGISQTAVMLGNVLAIATVGTLISVRVADTLPGHLAAAGVPRALRAQLVDRAGEVAEGRVTLPPDVPGGVAQAVDAAGDSAFVDGMRLAILVACLAVVATVALLPLIARPKSVDGAATEAAARTTAVVDGTVGRGG